MPCNTHHNPYYWQRAVQLNGIVMMTLFVYFIILNRTEQNENKTKYKNCVGYEGNRLHIGASTAYGFD